MSFKNSYQLGVATARVKMAEDEESFADRHPILASAGRALATGAGSMIGQHGLTILAGRLGSRLGTYIPPKYHGDQGRHTGDEFVWRNLNAIRGAGAALGAAGGNLLGGGDRLSAAASGLGALGANTAAGSAVYRNGMLRQQIDDYKRHVSPERAKLLEAELLGLYGVHLVGAPQATTAASASALTDAVRAARKKKKKDDVTQP